VGLESGLVSLDRQQIVPAPFKNNLPARFILAVKGVGHQDLAQQVLPTQQLARGGDFIDHGKAGGSEEDKGSLYFADSGFVVRRLLCLKQHAKNTRGDPFAVYSTGKAQWPSPVASGKTRFKPA
jgi:hypothetical protein